MVFNTESIENGLPGMRARLEYRIPDENTFEESLFIGFSGLGTEMLYPESPEERGMIYWSSISKFFNLILEVVLILVIFHSKKPDGYF